MGRRHDLFWSPWGGVAWTTLAIAFTEVALHLVGLPAPLPAIFLLAGLAGVSHASLRGGFRWGGGTAVLLAAYVLHYLSPHARGVTLEPAVLRGAAAMLVVGMSLAAPLAVLRRREERLRRAVEARNEDLEARNRELTEANAALEAFGYVVSHDLKEPVRAVENYLEAAEEEYGAETGRSYLHAAREANRRLHHMLTGLLAYSRASSTVTEECALDVADVLDASVCRAQYEGLLRERRARLDVADDIPRVMADEALLAQLLGSLVLNAIRHNPGAQPVVRVRAGDAPPGRVRVVIADNGPGFPPDVLALFGRVRASRPSTLKGGFGLLVSARAAQRLGARLWLENRDGGEVHLELDAAPSEAPAAGTARDA